MLQVAQGLLKTQLRRHTPGNQLVMHDELVLREGTRSFLHLYGWNEAKREKKGGQSATLPGWATNEMQTPLSRSLGVLWKAGQI
ncbi:hypothetical protein I79_003054 [Cricetulus griseus]|uniref:Uncharacterized protein n=1 Tax=Cricetulus griseus TaxID=10029 RepID=G3GZ03_CRIGR|nr:hypothetical protein I79_003054 [Cricetulus griseus]